MAHWGEAMNRSSSFRNVSASALCRLSIGIYRLRVFERGVGETQACGTGANAAGCRRPFGAVAEGVPVKVSLPGGVV